MTDQVLGAVTDGTWDYVQVGRTEFRAMCAAARELLELKSAQSGTAGLGELTAAGRLETTIVSLIQRLEVCVAEEQGLLLPRNHYIAVLCDAIRFAREEGSRPFAPIGWTPTASASLEFIRREQMSALAYEAIFQILAGLTPDEAGQRRADLVLKWQAIVNASASPVHHLATSAESPEQPEPAKVSGPGRR